MDKENNEQFKKLLRTFGTDRIVSREDMEYSLRAIAEIMDKFKDDNITLNKETKRLIEQTLDNISDRYDGIVNNTDNAIAKTRSELGAENKILLEQFKMVVEAALSQKPQDGKDADEEIIVEKVLSRVPKYEQTVLDEGEQIVAKINSLPTDDSDLKIDASHIKNFPEETRKVVGGVVARNIYQLGDVSLTNLTNGQTLVWDDTNKLWVNSSSGGASVGGSGTTNQITYWVDSDTVGALSTATYPSLTELSYVKGVTSAIQTQINTKVTKVGTPSDNQAAFWTGDGTLEGTSDITYDGTSFNVITGKNFQIAGATILSDSAGTTTLSNIDAIDATTEATIEAAIDTLANLTSIQGQTISISAPLTIPADPDADRILFWDDSLGATTWLTPGSGISISGTTLSASTGGLTWSEVTGTTQAAAVNSAYIANNAAQVVITLPDTAALGDRLVIVGKGAGGWRVAQNAGEIINFGTESSSTGDTGYIESTHRYDTVELVCITANTTWNVITSVGGSINVV